jgi:hypothetical protein
MTKRRFRPSRRLKLLDAYACMIFAKQPHTAASPLCKILRLS